MSREYVDKRLTQLGVQRRPKSKPRASLPAELPPKGKVILWSLTAGCWMLCDLRAGSGERLTEVK